MCIIFGRKINDMMEEKLNMCMYLHQYIKKKNKRSELASQGQINKKIKFIDASVQVGAAGSGQVMMIFAIYKASNDFLIQQLES